MTIVPTILHVLCLFVQVRSKEREREAEMAVERGRLKWP